MPSLRQMNTRAPGRRTWRTPMPGLCSWGRLAANRRLVAGGRPRRATVTRDPCRDRTYLARSRLVGHMAVCAARPDQHVEHRDDVAGELLAVGGQGRRAR